MAHVGMLYGTCEVQVQVSGHKTSTCENKDQNDSQVIMSKGMLKEQKVYLCVIHTGNISIGVYKQISY